MNTRLRVSLLSSLLALLLPAFAPFAQADKVAGVEIAVTDTIELNSGDKITGVIVSRDENGVVMDHPVLGRITIPNADIAVETPEAETPGLFGTAFLRGATRTVGFGLSGATGNTENLGLSATLRIAKETEHRRGNFASAYLFGTESGNTTQNQFFARYTHDFLLPESKFFLFANARFDYDTKRDWTERIAAGAGAGYQFYKDDRFDALGRLGFGFSKNFGSILGTDDVLAEMSVGVEFGWIIIEGMSLNLSNFYIPDLGDISEFRNITSLGSRIDLGLVRGLSFTIGMENEYISNSPAPTKKNDFRYIANLAYDL